MLFYHNNAHRYGESSFWISPRVPEGHCSGEEYLVEANTWMFWGIIGNWLRTNSFLGETGLHDRDYSLAAFNLSRNTAFSEHPI